MKIIEKDGQKRYRFEDDESDCIVAFIVMAQRGRKRLLECHQLLALGWWNQLHGTVRPNRQRPKNQSRNGLANRRCPIAIDEQHNHFFEWYGSADFGHVWKSVVPTWCDCSRTVRSCGYSIGYYDAGAIALFGLYYPVGLRPKCAKIQTGNFCPSQSDATTTTDPSNLRPYRFFTQMCVLTHQTHTTQI